MTRLPRVEPDVTSVVQALRRRTAAVADGLQAGDAPKADTVGRISRDVAAVTGAFRIRPDVGRLVALLSDAVAQVTPEVAFHAVGTVRRVGNGVAMLSGLPQARTDELVVFPTGVQGLVLNLERESLDVILLGPSEGIQGGDLVTSTGERLRVPVGHRLLGRAVDALGVPVDDRGQIDASEFWYVERDAPGIVQRSPVNEPLLTGWKIVDALVPIGRGQRELVIGDRQTGKTTLAVDTIINQRGKGVYCVYVAIGQKKSTTLTVMEVLRRHGAMDYTVLVVSGPDSPPALRYLAPYTGCTMAERMMADGRDVLIVYDDLTRHADAYRELSLLLRRPPGREAYPGDIFYLHSRLLERACKLTEDAGGGSLTALPIAETQRGNLSAYIPTNLVSITDGQILLDQDLYNRGIRPAVDAGRSVSRVGGVAQVPAMRALAANLRLELAQYEEVARFARFGGEIDEATQQQIRRGERWQRVLAQPAHQPWALADELLVMAAAGEGHLDALTLEQIPAFAQTLVGYMASTEPALYAELGRPGNIDAAVMRDLFQAIAAFQERWWAREGQ